MKKTSSLLLVAGLIAGSTLIGCSSKPSDDELKQLEDLKAEVASLEREISAKESEKASLAKAIADKDAQIKKCQDDKRAAQSRLQGM
ncbi:MAG TPA: hypothetical protein VNN76_02310 [Bacteroidota bacterium]|nr:hypothetical protein [Bacteroidota bacterium]